jgi:Mrp family chromosome partitioning ATPase
LARLCDAALLIVMAGSARPDSLRRAKEHLSHAGTRILGTVLNGAGSAVGSY